MHKCLPLFLQGESGEDMSPVSADWLPDLSAGQRTSVCSTGSEDTMPSPITRQLSGSKCTPEILKHWERNERHDIFTAFWSFISRSKMNSMFYCTIYFPLLRQRQTELGQWLLSERQHEAGGQRHLLQWTVLWSSSGPHWLHSKPVRCGVTEAPSESQGNAPHSLWFLPSVSSALASSRPPGSLLAVWDKTSMLIIIHVATL